MSNVWECDISNDSNIWITIDVRGGCIFAKLLIIGSAKLAVCTSTCMTVCIWLLRIQIAIAESVRYIWYTYSRTVVYSMSHSIFPYACIHKHRPHNLSDTSLHINEYPKHIYTHSVHNVHMYTQAHKHRDTTLIHIQRQQAMNGNDDDCQSRISKMSENWYNVSNVL